MLYVNVNQLCTKITAMKKTLTLILLLTLLNVLKAQLPDYVPTNGLVSFYEFDLGSLNDLGPAQANCNWEGQGQNFLPDKFGFQNNAINTFWPQGLATAPENPLHTPDFITVSAWVNIRERNTWSNEIGIVHLFTGALKNYGILLQPDNSIQSKITREADGPFDSQVLSNSSPLNFPTTGVSNDWYHVAFTYDGLKFKSYFNGVATDSMTFSSSSPLKRYVNTGGQQFMRIGGTNYAANFTLNSSIEEVGIWDRALNDNEVFELYNGCKYSVQITNTTEAQFQNICADQGTSVPVFLRAETNIGNSPTYTWLDSDFNAVASGFQLFIPSLDKDTTLLVTVSKFGCVSDTIPVSSIFNENPPEPTVFALNDLCEGKLNPVTVLGSNSFIVRNGLGVDDTITGNIFLVNDPVGSSSYSFQAYDSNSGCTSSFTPFISFETFESPSINIADQFICENLLGTDQSVVVPNVSTNDPNAFVSWYEIVLSDSFQLEPEFIGTDSIWAIVTNPSTGCTGSDTATVTIYSAFQTSEIDICEGETYEFENNFYSEGTYDFSYISSQGCDSIYTLEINEIEVSQLSITQNDANLTATAGFETYEWYNSDAPQTVLGTGIQFTATSSGNYTLRATNASGCEETATANVVLSSLNSLLSNNFIKLFPNPTRDVINIELKDIETVEIFSITGVKLAELSGASQYQFNTSLLSAGLYFVKAGEQTLKFVKN